jgi:hypothetical protein
MLCEKMAVTDIFRQCAVIEFLVKEGNSAGAIYERLRGVYGDACMVTSSVRRWVTHFKDGNTDIADLLRCGRPITDETERNRQKVDEIIRQNRRITFREIAAQLGVGAHAVQEMVEFRDIGNSVPDGFPIYLQVGTPKNWELLRHPTYSPDLAPSDYHLFEPLEGHLRGQHY